MDSRALLVLALLVAPLAGLAPAGAGGDVDAATASRTHPLTLEAIAYACDHGDGVCLGYEGVTPGPTLDVRLGDVVEVTLVNRIAETVAALDAPTDVRARLTKANVSFHVHGTSVPADQDGVGAHPGTALAPSVAPPGGSFTYRHRASYPGAWHYHDHVMGADGSEGVARGLYGALVVRGGGEAQPGRVLDLHLLDEGPNGGRGLDADVTAGERFEVVVVGLGDRVWDVTLTAPDGERVGTFRIGPGMSERFRVPAAEPGTYRWEARWGPFAHGGEVRAS